MKQSCSNCGQEKEHTQFNFRRTRNKLYRQCKECFNYKANDRRKTEKQKWVDYKGGKCQHCGYCKNIAALEFHHLDPKQKDFNLSSKDWRFNQIKDELDKCIVLCCNCHRKVHYENNKRIKNKTEDVVHLQPVKSGARSFIPKKCLLCDQLTKFKRSKYCSDKCARLGQIKANRPSKDLLKQELENSNYSRLAKKYNVSDVTIKRWSEQ